jgi:hypothetical protein
LLGSVCGYAVVGVKIICASSITPIALGSQLGPYEIVALIGAGGMREVNRGRDTRLDRGVSAVASHVPERLLGQRTRA